ncbi:MULTISPECIES: hypothetical protein [unclassified Streptomyces]|uniref:hypothetical protein n=1 Tax=unclassified Streptomyces TaxID=2593676 RepID=UPI0006F525C5|nr:MULTISPECIES: hypothetical protein [unclassified Streptomyces]KQX49554.1 hypothetical protein ASD33_17650 [Streptomyces sp. Root1304]KRA79173.1 hypothetical protein ASE09_22170 [Streptomyces sp. Root66D1]
MHTAVSPFVLQPWQEGGRHDRRSGWRGVSREFGEITLTCPLPRTAPETVVSEARGGLIPVATFEARGMHTDGIRLPTLNRSTLRVGDRIVSVRRNRWGATAAQRALTLRYAGDHYRLAALDKRAYVLTREPDDEDPGLTVTVRASGRGRKRQLAVHVGGRAEGGDLALALVFAGVDRSALTRVGAVRAGVSRVTDLWADSQY